MHVKCVWYSTFTICLLTFEQIWWNFTWQSIFAFRSWRVTKSLRILKSKLIDGGQLENWEKISISFYSLPKNSEEIVQITVFMPNYWNIQTFTISLQTFDQFWWSFAWWHVLAIQSITVVQKVTFKKNSRLWMLPFKKLSNAISQVLCHRFW